MNTLRTKNWLVHKVHDEELERYAFIYLRGQLLDIGCGTKPYRQMLAPFVTNHVGIDHCGTLHGTSNIDLFGTAYRLPIKDSCLDSAICTAALEHMEEPENALRECYRILKPGGVAIYSVPFIWHLHEEPRDFYRFSKYGLQYIFEKVGFELLQLKALSGFCVTFGQLLVYYLYHFRRRKLGLLWWVIPIVGQIIQRTSYVINRLDDTEQWTWAYMVVARKKEEGL